MVNANLLTWIELFWKKKPSQGNFRSLDLGWGGGYNKGNNLAAYLIMIRLPKHTFNISKN